MTKKFNEYRFAGLDYKVASNKYWTMNRVSEDERKIVVKVSDCHIVETRYGYAIILDAHHVVFVKDWSVSRNWYGNEVMFSEEYFNVKEWGDFSEDFEDDTQSCTWEHMLEIAKVQRDAENPVKWAR